VKREVQIGECHKVATKYGGEKNKISLGEKYGVIFWGGQWLMGSEV
jgi:hypothetical protein